MSDRSGYEKIIRGNIARSDRRFSDAIDVRRAHLCDISRAVAEKISAVCGGDLLTAVCTREEPKQIYDSLRGCAGSGGETFCAKDVSETDSLTICKGITDGKCYTAREVCRALSGSDDEPETDGVKIAFAPGKPANAAFETFAKSMKNVSAQSEESFSASCDSTAGGDSDYCIIPIENSSDGRLGSFYRLIEKNGLYIVMSYRYVSPDGENYTRFALCCGKMTHIALDGETYLHFHLTADGLDTLEDILRAGRFFGLRIVRADMIPSSVAGRDNSIDFIFAVENGDLAGFVCFLKLEYPQFSVTGIYAENGGAR